MMNMFRRLISFSFRFSLSFIIHNTSEFNSLESSYNVTERQQMHVYFRPGNYFIVIAIDGNFGRKLRENLAAASHLLSNVNNNFS